MRDTRTLSVRANLLIAALVPTLLFGIGASAALYVIARSQANLEVRAKLETIGGFLAQGVRLGLLTESAENLADPVRSALADPDIVHVAIYSHRGDLLIAESSAPVPGLPPLTGLPGGTRGKVTRLDGALSELVQVLRYPEQASAPEQLGFLSLEPEPRDARLGDPEGLVRVVMSTKRVAAAFREAIVWGAALMLLVLCVGAVLVWALSRGLLHAIAQLMDGVGRMGAGDLDVQVPDLGSGELAELGDAFNRMSGELRSVTSQLEAYSQGLERKVEERTAELDAARILAERANLAKSEFLANMSHEIRTPMTAILGYTELLLEASDLTPDVRGSLGVINRNGAHLLNILNDILDISKIEAGQLAVEQIPTDVVQIASETVSLMRVRADDKGLALRVTFPTPFPGSVLSDPTRIRQALVNLIGNAIKFTEVGVISIEVRYDSMRHMASLAVNDTGIGIKAGQLDALFRPFAQADSSVTRRFGGTGLGLAITRRVAQLLGGDCTVESRSGSGSRFTFSFSAEAAPGARLVEVTGEVEVGDEAEQGACRPNEQAPDPPLAARVLVAEDGPDNQRLISMMLRKVGAEVVVVENGRLAVERVEREPFDAVLMDMAMPEMDGYTATRTLRDLGHELPIIALTAHALSGERERCLEAGCSEYLTKPVDRRRLIATLAALLLEAKPEGS